VEHGEGQAVLAGHEVTLPLNLRPNGDHQCVAFTESAVEVAPGLKLGDAIGTPAAAEEFDDEGAEGKQVCGANHAASSILERKLRSHGAHGQDFVLDAGGEQLLDGALADSEALRLHKLPSVGSDLVELVLQCGCHVLFPIKASNRYSVF